MDDMGVLKLRLRDVETAVERVTRASRELQLALTVALRTVQQTEDRPERKACCGLCGGNGRLADEKCLRCRGDGCAT